MPVTDSDVLTFTGASNGTVVVSRARGASPSGAAAVYKPDEGGAFGSWSPVQTLDLDGGSGTPTIQPWALPDGRFLVAVPADPRLWSEHDVAVDHVRRYERAELLRLLTGAGFEIERLWSWNVLLRPLAALRRRRSTGSDLEEVPAVLNAGLRAVVVLERVLPVGRRRGVSLFAVAVPAKG
jgi:hypothetical protein